MGAGVDRWDFTTNGFGGINNSTTGLLANGTSGGSAVVANNNVITSFTKTLGITVATNDTFDYDSFVMTNATNAGYNYTVELIFTEAGGTSTLQLINTAVTGTSFASSAATGVAYTGPRATSVQLSIVMDNTNPGGQNDQAVLDNVSLCHNPIPEPSSALLSLVALGFFARRKR